MFGGASTYVMESCSVAAADQHQLHQQPGGAGMGYQPSQSFGPVPAAAAPVAAAGVHVHHPGFAGGPSAAAMPGFFHGSGLNLSLNHGLDLTCPNYQGLNLSVNAAASQQQQQQHQQPQFQQGSGERSRQQFNSGQQGLNLSQPQQTGVQQQHGGGGDASLDKRVAAPTSRMGSEVGLNLSLQNGMNLTNRPAHHHHPHQQESAPAGMDGNTAAAQSNVVVRKGNYFYSAQACLGYVNLSTLKSNEQAQVGNARQRQQQQQRHKQQQGGRISPLNLEHRSSPLNLTASDHQLEQHQQDHQQQHEEVRVSDFYHPQAQTEQFTSHANAYQGGQQGGKAGNYASCVYEQSQQQQQLLSHTQRSAEPQSYDQNFFSQTMATVGQQQQHDFATLSQNVSQGDGNLESAGLDDRQLEDQLHAIIAADGGCQIDQTPSAAGGDALDQFQAPNADQESSQLMQDITGWDMNQFGAQAGCSSSSQGMLNSQSQCLNGGGDSETVQQSLPADAGDIMMEKTNNSSKRKGSVQVVEEEVRCQHCDMTLSSGVDLKKHLDLAHAGRQEQEGRHPCQVCGLAFNTQGARQAHVDEAHRNGNGGGNGGGGVDERARFQCQWCDARLSCKETLTRHVRRVHDRRQPHECAQCGRRFAERGDLRKHEARHRAADAVPDCADCGKAFQTLKLLQRHKCPGPEGKFPCEICDKKLKTKVAWGVHMWKHTKDAKYIIMPAKTGVDAKRSGSDETVRPSGEKG